MKPQIREFPTKEFQTKEYQRKDFPGYKNGRPGIKEMKQDNVIRNSQRSEIKWRKIRFTERFMLSSGIRRNNFRCIGRYIKYSFIPAAAIAALAYFVNMYLAAVLAGCYVLSLIVFSFILEKRCARVIFGKAKCADAACFGRDEEYQYTVNGYSYFINVFRLNAGNDRRIYKLPAYRSTFMYSNAGDNMLVVRFGKNDIRCFSKKELGLTSHKAKAGSWSKLSKQEVDYVVKKEKEKLKEAKIHFGVNFAVMSVFSIFILMNFVRFFPYAVTILFCVAMIDIIRIKKRTSRIRKLRKTRVNALKNAVVSCFFIRKPSGKGGYNYVHYLKIMHPETGKFRLEKLKEYTWVSPFDNEVSDNIIVVDYGRKRKGRNMQHYMLEE